MDEGKVLELSSFSEDGERHLVETISRLSREFPSLSMIWPDGCQPTAAARPGVA
jgi:hypothetical protein